MKFQTTVLLPLSLRPPKPRLIRLDPACLIVRLRNVTWWNGWGGVDPDTLYLFVVEATHAWREASALGPR